MAQHVWTHSFRTRRASDLRGRRQAARAGMRAALASATAAALAESPPDPPGRQSRPGLLSPGTAQGLDDRDPAGLAGLPAGPPAAAAPELAQHPLEAEASVVRSGGSPVAPGGRPGAGGGGSRRALTPGPRR